METNNASGLSDHPVKRLKWIDAAKGSAIFLVIYGHLLYSGTWDIVNRAIYSFHMPMFFVLSGWVWGVRPNNTNFKQFVKQKTARLLLPSCCFVILGLPLYLYSLGLHHEFHISQILSDIFYVKGFTISSNAPVWFFICLFEVYIINKITNICNLRLSWRLLSCIVIFFLGWSIYISKSCPVLSCPVLVWLK